MSVGKAALLRVHAGAFNGHDVESILGHCLPAARCTLDGHSVGEGPEAVRRVLQAEYATHDELVGRVMEVNGEQVLVEWAGPEGRGEPRGIVRLEAQGDRVCGIHIDHDSAMVRRLVESAARHA
jgi:hypothetical protein